MSRIACLIVPMFPLAARLRSEPELRQEALAILAGEGNAARVVAATRVARRAGIRPGFTLSQARSRLPKLIARSRDAACESAAREALLDVAESFSPRVEDRGEGMVYLDAEGLEGHYPGDQPEQALARALLLEVERRAGLPARAGIAANKLAARVAAGQSGTPTIVAAGSEAAFLAPLPMSRLTPESETLATLERWGIRSVGDFAKLPRAEVVSRLGQVGQDLQAVALGADPRPLMPRQPPPSFREGMELEWPLINLEPFLFMAHAALERLTRRMAGHGLACAQLELQLDLEPDGHHQRSIALPAPSRDIKTLLTLIRLDLEAHPPAAPIVSFSVIAHPDRPREAQMSLFGPAALSPDKLATTLARLFALLGEDRVGAPRPQDAHRPEGFCLVPYAPPPPPKERREPKPRRNLLSVRVLRPPLPIEVLAEQSAAAAAGSENGRLTDRPRPRTIQAIVQEETEKRPKIEGDVKVASGPWGLEEAWWTSPSVEREYWDVELSGGGLYRIYRDGDSGDWYADGVYD